MENATSVMTARELAAQIRLRTATATLARQSAKRKAIEQLRAKGHRVHDYSNRELSQLAEQYLSTHSELWPRTRALAEEMLRKRR